MEYIKDISEVSVEELKNISCCSGLYSDLIIGDFIYNRIYKHILGFTTNVKSNEQGKRILGYCPHCGAKLPDLSNEYDDCLEEAVGKEYCDIKPEDIPEEFKSDAWWKKRGL